MAQRANTSESMCLSLVFPCTNKKAENKCIQYARVTNITSDCFLFIKLDKAFGLLLDHFISTENIEHNYIQLKPDI